MRVPKDIYGRDFADHLIRRWSFREVRQIGSHIILRTDQPFGLTLSIPAHKPLKPGTFRGLINAVAEHRGVEPQEILHKL